jgi:four helix bundle protein
MGRVRFEFKKLVVYQVALRFFGSALEVSERLPKSRIVLVDQFIRAALSIVLNIAEAAGLWRMGNKRKHYEYARGSTFETSAMLDVLLLTKTITREEFEEREEELAEVGARLTRLCQRYDRARSKPTK